MNKCAKYSDLLKNMTINYNFTMDENLILRLREMVQKLKISGIKMVHLLIGELNIV